MIAALSPQVVTTTDERDFDLAAEVIEAGRLLKLLESHPSTTPAAKAAARASFDSAQAAFMEARAMEAA